MTWKFLQPVKLLGGGVIVGSGLSVDENGKISIKMNPTISIQLTSNQGDSDQSLIGATISVVDSSGTSLLSTTWQGEVVSLDINISTVYTITVGDVTNYKTPDSITSTAVAQSDQTHTFLYQTELVSITLVSYLGTPMIGAKVALDYYETETAVTETIHTYTGPFSVKVPFGKELGVMPAEVTGFNTPMGRGYTASQAIREYVFKYTFSSTGAYIYTTDNALVASDNWDTSWNAKAVGVALITDSYKLLIAPDMLGPMAWSDSTAMVTGLTNYSSSTDAFQDMNGQTNTQYMLAVCSSADYAAGACANYTFKNSKTGYLPSMGELYLIAINAKKISTCLKAFGGTDLSTDDNTQYYWSSTQNTTITRAFVVGILNKYDQCISIDQYKTTGSYYVRPFTPLTF